MFPTDEWLWFVRVAAMAAAVLLAVEVWKGRA